MKQNQDSPTYKKWDRLKVLDHDDNLVTVSVVRLDKDSYMVRTSTGKVERIKADRVVGLA